VASTVLESRGDPSKSLQAPALRCRGLRAVLGRRVLLDRVDLEVQRGESIAVMGPSGAGKTTLLNCLAGLRLPDDGEVHLGAEPMSGASSRRRARLRLHHIGMVFQFGELLPELTVFENVALPLRLRGQDDGGVADLLKSVDLGGSALAFPAELSGGEVQRVAIARALTGSPTLLLADEPTGALDEAMTATACHLLLSSARHIGAGLVVATHDPQVAGTMDRTLRLRSGKLEVA
jgi:putative ABC transport system ATP-binding protein